MYHDVALKTEVGQMLDLLSQPQGRKGPEVLAQFSKKRLEQIVDYKTAFYTFYVPLASALLVSGFEEDRHLKLANDIAILLGRKFQTQDDYLDCFADPKHLGKVGTDIQDHKCTWLLVHALELVAPEQRRVIEENLGREDEASIARIKQLYLDLGLDKLYAKHEQDTYEEIINISKENADLVPPVLFTLMLDQIHLRTK
jgi:farnesyl diphosphate synthase